MSSENTRSRRSRKSIAFQPNTPSTAEANKDEAPKAAEAPVKSSKKSRSKSLGPGGLDALNATSSGGGRGLKDIAPAAQVKSILKPTLPLSPIQMIPAYFRRAATAKAKMESSSSSSQSKNTLNFQPPPQASAAPKPTTIPVRTEEDQQRRSEILAARAARRQSLGNRRVSFAPEATLHTWDVVEYYRGDDGSSTPGSSVGGSSRTSTPASSKSKSDSFADNVTATPTPNPGLPDTVPERAQTPETPPQLPENPKKNPRVSLQSKTPPMNFNNPADDPYFSSSPFSSSPGPQSPFGEIDNGNGDSDSMDSSDGDDDTVGGRTFATQAGESTMGDISMQMEMADDDVTGAFKPFFKKPSAWRLEGMTESTQGTSDSLTQEKAEPREEDLDGEMDMDTTRPVGGLLSAMRKPAALNFDPSHAEVEDEDGEMTMDITRPVGGLLQSTKPVTTRPSKIEDDMTMDMDTTRPVGGILSSAANALEKAKRISLGYMGFNQAAADEDMTTAMDETRALGGILSNAAHVNPSGFGNSSDDNDMTMAMDETRALGGIIAATADRVPASPTPSMSSEMNADEEMTMEFTSVLGGIIGASRPKEDEKPVVKSRRRSSIVGKKNGGGMLMSGQDWEKEQKQKTDAQLLNVNEAEDEGGDMDMTVALGGILPSASSPSYPVLEKPEQQSYVSYPVLPSTQEQDDTSDDDVDMEGVTMDITTAFGSILPASKPSSANKDSKSLSETFKSIPEEWIPSRQPAATPKAPVGEEVKKEEEVKKSIAPTSKRRSGGSKRTSVASPAVTEGRVTRRTSALRASLEKQETPPPKPKTPTSQRKHKTPKSTPKQQQQQPEEVAITSTPQKNLVPQPSTPPQQLTPQVPISKPKTPSKKTTAVETPVRTAGTGDGFIFGAKKRMGFSTSPSPKKLVSPMRMTPNKGMGIDRPGLGSPRVAAILSRRKSIGEDMPKFSPVGIPRDLLMARIEEEKREREEARQEKENEIERQKGLDLRSRIDMLTPRKASRKSVAFGSLMGGKRDRDEATEADVQIGGSKRRSLEGGKYAPSSSESTPEVFMGRVTRSRASMDRTASLPTPGSGRKQTPRKQTPKKQTPKKKAVVLAPREATPPVETKEPTPEPPEQGNETEEIDDDGERISLQEFLDMTSISFLDGLTTTRRRQTGFIGAKKAKKNSLGAMELDTEEGEDASLADCVIAGACTVPMLELFQYSCRELKKYIKEGREVVKVIEQDTLEDNPLMFREYVYAPPDIKLLMDTQFKHVKTHSRLLARGIWYEWRMKLMEGVKEGLVFNLKGLKEDEEFLAKQREVLDPVLPGMIEKHDNAKRTLEKLVENKRRVEQDDKKDLETARERLKEVTRRIEEAREKLTKKLSEVAEMDAKLAEREERKKVLQASIDEAERIKEQNRGWTEEEVASWRDKVHTLEKTHGWSITSITGSAVEMVFLKQLRFVWDSKGTHSPTVEYVQPAFTKASDPIPMPKIEQGYFIAALNKHLQDSRDKDPKHLIAAVETFWTRALERTEQIRRVRSLHPTSVAVSMDNAEKMEVTAKVLIPEVRSKLEIGFLIYANGGLETSAKVVYGGVNEDAVAGLLKEMVNGGKEGWREVVGGVVGRCLEGRRRGGMVVATKK